MSRHGSKDSVLNSALVPRTVPDRRTAEFGDGVLHRPGASPARRSPATSPTEQAALIAATQRPVADAAFSERDGPPAWKHLPSWAVVATGDKAAGTDVVRSMAQRAGAKITEVDGSHVIMISQPEAVTERDPGSRPVVAGSTAVASAGTRAMSVTGVDDRQRATTCSAPLSRSMPAP